MVVMGVTGSGKTTIGNLLAARTGWQFADADDYHSAANKQKMHAGIPLTDEDRVPWLAALHDLLMKWHEHSQSGILACSALKQSYRETLSQQIPESKFIFLDASREVLQEHLANRSGHYMNPDLLDSQLQTLEIPSDAIRVSVAGDPQTTVNAILAELKPESA
jgi:gluconokinase